MLLLVHETEDDARASAKVLAGMGAAARRLLVEAVEHQELARKSLSPAARKLWDAGFIFVRDTGDMWAAEFKIQPSLAGEEALEMLEIGI